MCQSTTWGRRGVAAGLAAGVLAVSAPGQNVSGGPLDLAPGWRRIGNAAVGTGLAAVATGPVVRVWYSQDGARLFVRTLSGQVFESRDFESWQSPAEAVPEPAPAPGEDLPPPPFLPEAGARLRAGPAPGAILYALGRAAYRSDDAGLTWVNLTDYRREPLLGDGLADLAVAPGRDAEIVVAGRSGVWRSVDGGLSWSGLNGTLPNLPVRRILAPPARGRGMRVVAEDFGELEWPPGERVAWRPVSDGLMAGEERLKELLEPLLSARLQSAAMAGDFVYAGAAEGGRLWTSADGGRSWRPFTVSGGGAVHRIFVSPVNPRLALAALGENAGPGRGAHVLRTTNGGLFWDDLTANLPDAPAYGVTAHLPTGAVYVASRAGVYFTIADLEAAGPATGWLLLAARWAPSAVRDVALDAAGNQLYAAVDGAGVFAVMAPHRFLAPAVVNSADLTPRPASPGVLLSVMGREVVSARAGQLEIPVLAAAAGESQVQVPFDVRGSTLSVGLTASRPGGEFLEVGLPLRDASPAIFLDRDGSPMVFDADSGVLLDVMHPARPGSRIQILATGLGRVAPAWPAGLPAPLENPPRVVAPVRVFLDRVPLEVSRAVLAPGYVGFYLIEVEIPRIVNLGPVELFVEAAGERSDGTRIYLEP